MSRLVLSIAVCAALLLSFESTFAQADPDYEATISALQTRVAELEEGQNVSGSVATATPATTEIPIFAGSPTPLGQFDLLYYYFVDDGGETYVFGEVQNVSEAAGPVPSIVFTFLGENGHVYGEETIYPELRWAKPGERAPFQRLGVLNGALRLGDWVDVAVAAGDVTAFATAEVLDTSDLAIDSVPLEGPAGGMFDSIDDEIINNGDESTTGVIVLSIAYYDADGRFIGACSGEYIDISIPSGGSARFSTGVGGGCGFVEVGESMSESDGGLTYRLLLTRSPF